MEEEKKTGNVKVGDEYFHNSIYYRNREYWVDEVHDPEKMKGKWCITVEVPGVNHSPKIFTISVNEYDNEADNDALNIKRPALFNTIDDARIFCEDLMFLKSALRVTNLTDDLVHHKLFKEFGVYIVRRSSIVIPTKSVDLEKMFREVKPVDYGTTKGIIL